MLWVPAVHTGNLEKQCVNSFKNSGTKPTSVTGSDTDGRGAVPQTGRGRLGAKARRPARLRLCRRSRPRVRRAWTGRRGLRRGRRAAPRGDSPWTRPEQPVRPRVCGRGSVRTRPCAPPSCCPDRREAVTESPVRIRELAAPSPGRSGVCPCAALPVARWATAGPAPAASLAVLETATRPRTAVGTHQTAAPVSRDLPHAGGSALGELTHVALSF